MISATAHVVVVGGGVLGCAIAFRLARSGLRITLVERDACGQHASGKNAGNLNPIFMTPPALLPLALESFRLHAALAGELAALGCLRYAVEPVRRIVLAFDDAEGAGFDELARQFEGRDGYSATLVDAQALRRLEPRLSDAAQSGLLMEGAASLDGMALTCALAEAAAQLGATRLRDCVRQLRTESGRATAVVTDQGDIGCDAVVLATGPWVAETRQWLGLSLPVEPVKGQLLRMKLPGAGLRCDLSHGGVSLYRRGRGEVWVGATQEHSGMDVTPTEAGRRELQAEAVRIMPEMARAELLEHSAALRPTSLSGLPIVGLAAGWDNVYVANGAGMKGLLLCTGIAQALHDLMLIGRSRVPLDPK